MNIDPSAFDYATHVPVFASGAEARAHGIGSIDHPGERAQRMIAGLLRSRHDAAIHALVSKDTPDANRRTGGGERMTIPYPLTWPENLPRSALRRIARGRMEGAR